MPLLNLDNNSFLVSYICEDLLKEVTVLHEKVGRLQYVACIVECMITSFRTIEHTSEQDFREPKFVIINL